MSAYRFFRKEMVPIIKQQEPLLDSKGRHQVVHQLWTSLHDRHKLAYVLMSRADREKSLYIIRLNQIKDELRKNFPDEYKESQDYLNSFTKSLALEALQNEYDLKIHAHFALESVHEKIEEEKLSQDEDEDDNESDRELGQFKKKMFFGQSRQEYFHKKDELRFTEVDRVTKKFQQHMKIQDISCQTADSNCAVDIAACLLDPLTLTTENDGMFSNSIFSKEITSKMN